MLNMEENSYWRTVVDTIKDGLLIISPEGAIVTVNNAMVGLTGYEKNELIGKPCSVLDCDMCRTVRNKIGEHWCNLFQSGGINMKRCGVRKKNGEYLPVLKNAALLKNAGGQVIGAVETLTDISEIIQKDHQIEAFRRELQSRDGFQGLIGNSPAMSRVFDLISNAAQSDAPVIIFGESGTGKELVAKAIHELGPRKKQPFIKFNCAALTGTLLESELFGHVKGAYTGAFRDREGRFEAANHGDIFLDEIGDLPPETQVKLLRVLEDKTIERVGDNRPIPVDVRIVSATNKVLKDLVVQRLFREDLFFRVNVIPIQLPPLRERKEDIPVLAEFFFRRIKLKTEKPILGISEATMKNLIEYDWPGNVRELRSAFEYAFVTCPEGLIQPDHLPVTITEDSGPRKEPELFPLSSPSQKKKELLEALKKAGGNQVAAARLLGVSRVTIWNRMKKYGVQPEKTFV
ncbi:MAG: sigma 54-interacting transcriptional regulator [Deltaproteobacteria bacterium]|nr:sigma 54-interacting transcriptional regulator [Deltaproteobacteria bacterium]